MHKELNKKEKRDSRGGYALLLSVLISSLILAIGLGLLSIVEKKTILSSIGRESQKAFYAADSGGECALYWDRMHEGFGDSVFATSTQSTTYSGGEGIECSGQDIAESWVVTDLNEEPVITSFEIAFTNGTCATVDVEKENGGLTTTILTRGHNTCDLESPRIVERAIRVVY